MALAEIGLARAVARRARTPHPPRLWRTTGPGCRRHSQVDPPWPGRRFPSRDGPGVRERPDRARAARSGLLPRRPASPGRGCDDARAPGCEPQERGREGLPRPGPCLVAQRRPRPAPHGEGSAGPTSTAPRPERRPRRTCPGATPHFLVDPRRFCRDAAAAGARDTPRRRAPPRFAKPLVAPCAAAAPSKPGPSAREHAPSRRAGPPPGSADPSRFRTACRLCAIEVAPRGGRASRVRPPQTPSLRWAVERAAWAAPAERTAPRGASSHSPGVPRPPRHRR